MSAESTTGSIWNVSIGGINTGDTGIHKGNVFFKENFLRKIKSYLSENY